MGYRLWLYNIARMAESDFLRKVQNVVKRFNEQHAEEGLEAEFRAGPTKTYEQIKKKEQLYGESTHKTYEGRVLASKVLDCIRCSVTVNTARAAVTIYEEFFRPLKLIQDKLHLVRVRNRFNENAETLAGYRNIEMNLLWDGGLRSGKCGRPNRSLRLSLIGEVQIVLKDFIAVRKRRHLLYKCSKGDFAWPPEDGAAGIGSSSS